MANVTNSIAVQFVGTDVRATYMTFWEDTGSNTYAHQCTQPIAGNGQLLPVNFAADAITLTEHNGAFSDANSEAALTARKNKISHVAIHSADPGPDHTGSMIGDRQRVTWNAVPST